MASIDEMRSRAQQLLERTHYDETERVADARMCARYVLELADHCEDAMRAAAVQAREVERLRELWFQSTHGESFP